MPDQTLPYIPGYTITAQLHAGTRTAVYRAVSESHGESVVIKVLRTAYPSINELVRFRNQYIIAKNLAIPGIVNPLELISWNHSYALVMEDVEGIALTEYIQCNGRLSISQILAIVLQLTDILHQLGRHRVLHKDINPANVLIHPDTQKIWLTDFSLASLLPKETQGLQSPNKLEGTLAYIAPEQTGRMNRGIDYRADFYGLGVTLYELLTGQLPFTVDDPLELIHCHIAKVPSFDVASHQSPVTSQEQHSTFNIPTPLSEIVLKLMAKNAEDRYQSALGLKHDLQICLRHWDASGQIESFELGQADRCDRFLIPEKLYGREAEVQALLEAFDRVAQGTSELMLVAGFSGIGKTAVVNEIHKPITRKKGYFIKGKFDQLNRNIPFSGFVQALRHLMEQLLSESDTALADWQTKILAAIGQQGQVLIDVIPELALIIGPQPQVPELSGMAAKNRFNRLFGLFVQVFATPEHPLTLFLDDLQWIDAASLTLLKRLMTQAQTGYLLILGGYRDNEVSAVHPLMQMLDDIPQNATTVHTLTLTPLKQDSIHQLVAESLACSVETAAPLAQLVYQKTQGNPFFTTQFLQGLQADGWITFNAEVGHWECDLGQIRALALTDDVVEFMVRRLQQWPQSTQQALAIAACLGNQFDLDSLSRLCEQSPEALAQELWPALQAGLLIPENETYKFFKRSEASTAHQFIPSPDVPVTYRFLHDRVQQAAYAFIPEGKKQQTHTRIGWSLLNHLPPEKQEDFLFDIVNQLNMGRDFISKADEQQQLISLNLRAGIKAKSATAYKAALDYFDIGLEMLSEEGWQQNYPLALALHENAAEAAALAGDGERLEALIQAVTTQAKTSLDTVKTLQVKMQDCLGQNQPLASIEIARSLLKELGVVLPDSSTMEDVQQSLETFKQFSAQLSFDEIVALPVLTDSKKLAIVNTLILVITSLMIVEPTSFLQAVLMTTQFSLEQDNSPAAAYGYALYAILIKNLEQDIDTADAWGNLAVRLLHTPNPKTLENRVYHTISAFITHEKRHVEETLSVFQQAYNSGVEHGDFEFASYSLYLNGYNLYFLGRELSLVKQEIIKTTEVLLSIGQHLPVAWNQCFYHTIAELSGVENKNHPLWSDYFDGKHYVKEKQEQNDGFGLCYFYFNRATLRYILGDYPQALEASTLAKDYLAGPAGMLTEVVFYFYDSLIRLACADGPEAANELANVRENQQKMKRWAENAPMNFQHKYELIRAEEHRVLGDRLAAMDAYESAIAGAKENAYLQEEALANELAAKFYLGQGKIKIAAVYMQEAYYCYERWGAKAKTIDLANQYADLLQPILRKTQTIDPLKTLDRSAPLHLSIHSSSSSEQKAQLDLNSALDLATILKSARALSEDLDLSELLENLAPMMLQTSGAERLALLLPDAADGWQLKVLATAETIQLVSESLATHANLPIQLIQYVQRTQEVLVLDGAVLNEATSSLPLTDPYLEENPHRSVLCLPLLHQSKLNGVLYLEHHSVAGVFTRDRITILNFLCAQAAISLENAQLNQSLEQKLEVQTTKRRESETRFQNMVNNIPGVIHQSRSTPDGNVSFPYVSDDCYDLYGVSAEDVMSGQYSLRDFEHDKDSPLITQMIAEGMRKSQPFEHEFRIVTLSGNLKWVQVINHPTQTLPDGTILWNGIVMDVSDRKIAELALKDSQAQLRYMTENVPGMIYQYVAHPDGTDELTYVSSQVREIFEVEPEIALENTDQIWGRIHPDDFSRIAQDVQRSAETLQPFVSAYRLVLPEHGTRWVKNMSRVERLDNGDVVWDGIVMDISDRKAAELALEQEVLRRTTIFNTSSDGIHIIDLQGNLLEANASFFQMLGYTPEESRPLNVADWDAQWNKEELEDIIQNYAWETSEIWTFETLHRRKDSSVFSVEISVRSMEWNKQVSLVCIARDISERKRAEAQLQRTNEELIRATRLKDEFLANMSHELRTPLNSILGLSEALQEEVFGPLTGPQLKYLKVIEQSGTHLLSLINDILDVSKIESGKLELNVNPVNVVSLCEASMAFIKQQALTKRIFLETKIPFPPLSLLIDERRILQSLVNLLNNAVKFTAEGGCVVLSVSRQQQGDNREMTGDQSISDQSTSDQSALKEKQPANKVFWESDVLTNRDYITLSVSDTGIGISPEHLKNLFKPFSQIDSTLNRKYSGTGLGLVLVKQIAELHGGTVSLTSEVGVGSCFRIHLPYAPDLPLQETETLSDKDYPLTLPTDAQQGESPLILLAEDNENNVNLTVSYLENKGYRLIVANNGLEAVELAKAHLPAVILMDIQMPELDGLESIRQIRQAPQLKLTPIIALTALAMKDDQTRCLAAGANLYHSKPVQLKALVLSIQQLLS